MKILQTSKSMLFAISLMATALIFNACGDDDETPTLEDIEVAISAAQQTVKKGESVTFSSDLGSAPTTGITYAWTFEGGSPATSSDAAPTVTYAAPGTYDVSLTVTRDSDKKTFSKSATDFVTVNDIATAAFSTSATEVFEGESVTFTSTSAAEGTLAWVFEGGDPANSTDKMVTVSYDTPGTYKATLTETVAGEAVSKEETITVKETEVTASFTPTEVQNIMEGDKITFTSTSTEGATLSWAFEGGSPATSDQGTVEVTYATEGTYKVSLTATKGSGSDGVEIGGLVVVSKPAAAMLSSTMMAEDGTKIYFIYDKELNDPSGETIAVTVDAAAATVSSIGLKADDAKIIEATLDTPITFGQVVTATYASPGITAADGSAVMGFTDEAIVNTVPKPSDGNLITNFDLDFETGTIETTMGALGGAGGAVGTAEISDVRASTGTKSLHLIAVSNNGGGGTVVITTNTSASAFTFESAKTYTISFDIYTESAGAEGTVRMQPLAAWGENKKFFATCCGQTVGEWTTLTWEVTGVDIPEGKVHIQLIPTDDSNHDVYIDNFRIEEKM